MKITQLREKDGNLTLSTTDLDTFLQKIKTETKTQPVSTFRQQLRYCLPGKRCNEADRLPKVLPAAEFRKTNGVCQMKTYNGIVELTVGPLSGKSEIALVKRLAWEQPQTRLVFTGSSGRTVKIWTTFTRPNNSLPGKREEAEVFHAHAYRLAVKCYQPQLPFDILLKEPKLEQYSRLSFDPEAMYRPDSIQFYLAQPVSMPDETTYREALQDEKSPLTRAVPGYEAEEAIIMLFEAICIIDNEKDTKIKLSRCGIVWTLFLVLATCHLVALALYIAFTGVGSQTVAGVQARYLIPLIIPYACLLLRFPIYCDEEVKAKVTAFMLGAPFALLYFVMFELLYIRFF